MLLTNNYLFAKCLFYEKIDKNTTIMVQLYKVISYVVYLFSIGGKGFDIKRNGKRKSNHTNS